MSVFRAFWVEKDAAGGFQRAVVERDDSDLPAGELLVEVRYSSLNYKDGLSASGSPGVTRNYPHTPQASTPPAWCCSPRMPPSSPAMRLSQSASTLA